MLRIAYKTINHPLHKEFDDIEGGLEKKFKIKRERIREYVIKNSRYELIKDCMEYAASKNKPSLHVISVLIVNGASLLASYVIDAQTQKSITVKEKLQQLGGEYNALIDKSIFTIIRKVHKLIFDFPMIGKEGIDLLKVVSEIPSEKGCFVESAEDLILFNKIGDEGKREFLSLLQTCINDCDFSKFRHRLSLLSSESVSKKEREHAYVILNECVKVGYLAIATGDDRVIIDYLLEIKEESKQSKNPYLKKLYEKFFEILSDYDDLPKSMFLSRCFRYIVRTVKSYSGYEWNPAWEKIFTGPGYRTDVGEWSKNNYEEIIKAKDKRSTKRIEELAEGRRKAEQKAEQIRNVSGIFTREILKLDEEELRDIVADSQEKVVERVVKESNTAPKKLLQAIIEEIKWKEIKY
ncbi:hypothetical protein [Wolbachia endosymbiont of Chironomus riparius]|uniref:hypothetical protein n=1 Tax=Wolbachia endosymbiont of Chironomus riparius TaxID=2883238 RepID=UPI0020A20BB5|nr:hypothetical protein [Wolbachia endosymbiont of Chironomus riparius]